MNYQLSVPGILREYEHPALILTVEGMTDVGDELIFPVSLRRLISPVACNDQLPLDVFNAIHAPPVYLLKTNKIVKFFNQ